MYDLWRSGFIRHPLADIVARGGPTADEIVWLPAGGPFDYLADPFPIERDGTVTVFAEWFDYRIRRGEIHALTYDRNNRLIARAVALAEPWHLSYPTLLEDQGELFMLPEGYRSGGLTLYRCTRFPDRWEPVARITDEPAIDATVVRHQGRWWMFHALPGPDDRAMRELHLQSAASLTGPWTPHPLNPVLTGWDRSRPGGTPLHLDGVLHLPVQDCTGAYGVAINLLRIDRLELDAFAAEIVRRFEPGDLLPEFGDGLHTLSGHAGVSCVDLKQVTSSPSEPWVRLTFKTRKLLGLNGPKASLRSDAAPVLPSPRARVVEA